MSRPRKNDDTAHSSEAQRYFAALVHQHRDRIAEAVGPAIDAATDAAEVAIWIEVQPGSTPSMDLVRIHVVLRHGMRGLVADPTLDPFYEAIEDSVAPVGNHWALCTSPQHAAISRIGLLKPVRN